MRKAIDFEHLPCTRHLQWALYEGAHVILWYECCGCYYACCTDVEKQTSERVGSWLKATQLDLGI